MRRLITGAQFIMLLVLTSVVLTGCKDNEEERIRQALTDMGYMDGVSETDITAEAETKEVLAAALPEDLTTDRSAEAIQNAGEAFVSEAVSAAQNTAPPSDTASNPEASIPKPEEVLPNPAEVLPSPTGAIPKPEEVLPKPEEVFPKPGEMLPNPAEILPDPAGLRACTY